MTPEFRALTREEIHAVLARNNVGRIAYARGNAIDVQPMHYAYEGGWLYGRTCQGTELEVTGERWWPVAFEVDEVRGIFDWCSVVVHGGFYTLLEGGAEWERQEREKAIEILRTLIPEAFAAADPLPFRDVVFRIAVQEVSGRCASLAGEAANGAAASRAPDRAPPALSPD